MKTFKINLIVDIDGEAHEDTRYIRTDASEDKVNQAIQFVKMGEDPEIDKLLQAIRTLGSKATEIKLEPIATFSM